jgi:L-alanine-DL-glutamate epimerase-like enolase superfamily enzyme
MKITGIEPFATEVDGRNYVFCVIDTDEGIAGIGEAGLGTRAHAIVGAFRHLEGQLVGGDPARIEHLWQVMYRGGFFPGGNVVASAISAVDIALWDIKGQALGVPVYELLGGRVRDRVVCYPHNRADSLEQLLESAGETTAAGWKFVRWHLAARDDVFEPRRAVRDGVRWVEEVRKAVGDDVELCLDVHTRLDPSDAIELATALEPYRLFFLEDPIRSEDPHSFRRLRAATRLPLAAGEQFAGKWAFREMVEGDLIDYARVDLCIVGGISEARKVAGWCETHYIRLATHNPLGPVSSAACLHLNLATSNFGVQEQPVRPGSRMTDLFPVQAEWQDGYLLPPTRPGLGIEFDREALRRAAPARAGSSPRLRRADGAFTNW